MSRDLCGTLSYQVATSEITHRSRIDLFAEVSDKKSMRQCLIVAFAKPLAECSTLYSEPAIEHHTLHILSSGALYIFSHLPALSNFCTHLASWIGLFING